MKAMVRVALMVGVVALLVASGPLHASEMDDRIESSARNSYIFATYLNGDDIKIQSMDGAVTLTGIVAENFHKSLAQETVAGLPGVKSVANRLEEVKGAPLTANSDACRGTLVTNRVTTPTIKATRTIAFIVLSPFYGWILDSFTPNASCFTEVWYWCLMQP